MANTFRYRYGETNPVAVVFDTAFAIELGSLVVIATANTSIDSDAGTAGKLYSMNKVKWDTDTATTQTAAHLMFAGVAMQAYDGTNVNAYGIKSGKIRVATDGVFEFTCASASFKVGDLVGPAKASGNDLEDQKVVAVATELLAIGRVVEATTSATTVKVRITSPKAVLNS